MHWADLFEKFKLKYEKREKGDNENDREKEEEEENDEDPNMKLNGDIVDMIMLNIKDGSRHRREISTQLVNIGCVTSADDLKVDMYKTGKNKLGRTRIWRNDDLDDLKQCFEIIKEECKQT